MSNSTTARHAVVSGGGTGIGLAIAAGLIADGFTVTLLARNAERLADACATLGPKADAQPTDVSRRSECVAAIEAIMARHKRIDVLVNNAGLLHKFELDTPIEEAERMWDEVLATNLKGAFLMSFAAQVVMTAPGGRIINISSITAASGGSKPGYLAYSAAKGGVEGMMRAFANVLGPRGITVNTVAPGIVLDTQMSVNVDRNESNPTLQTIAMRRFGQPHDIATAVRWLASPGAGFVTGTVVPVNGGQHYR